MDNKQISNIKLARIEQYFRDELDSLISELLKIYNDIELSLIKIFVGREELTPKILQVFIEGILPFENLLNKDYNKFFSSVTFPTIANVNLNKLREIMLDNRSLSNRDIIVKYFELFIKLCKNYNLIKNTNK